MKSGEVGTLPITLLMKSSMEEERGEKYYEAE